MLSYEDVAAASAWLCDAFGFRVVGEPYVDGEKRITHTELTLEGATVYLGWPGPTYLDPIASGQVP